MFVHRGWVYLDAEEREIVAAISGVTELPPDGPVELWLTWIERELAQPSGDSLLHAALFSSLRKDILQQLPDPQLSSDSAGGP